MLLRHEQAIMRSAARRDGRLNARRQRRAIAWLASLALLLELFLGLPASLAMAAEITAGGGLICTGTGPQWVPGDQWPGAPQSHRHNGCVLCHGGVGAALLADAPPNAVLPAASMVARLLPAPMPAAVPVPRPAYAPRAPPAIVLI